MRKTASSPDCLFHPDSVCFLASGHLITLCSSYSTLIFFGVIWRTVCVFSLLHEKRENSRLQPSGLPNWTASHFSFMPLCADQGSHTELFVARQHQGYLFCLLECKVNRRGKTEIGKRSHNCDVNERHEQQTGGGSRNGSIWAKKKKLEVKERGGSGETKKQAQAWSCKGGKREGERQRRSRKDADWNRDGMDGWMRTMRQIGPSPVYGQLE